MFHVSHAVYKAYFDKVLVVYEEPDGAPPFQRGSTMATVVKKVVLGLLSERSINLLCFGMKLVPPQLHCVVPNQSHLILCEDPWEWLLGHIGERRMFMLLKTSTMFVKQDNSHTTSISQDNSHTTSISQDNSHITSISQDNPRTTSITQDNPHIPAPWLQICGCPVSDVQFGRPSDPPRLAPLVPPNRHGHMYKGGRFGPPPHGWTVQCGFTPKTVVLTKCKHLKLLDYYCPRANGLFQPINNVSRFVYRVTCCLFKAIVRLDRLRAVIRRQIFTFVRLRRFERLRGGADGLLAGFKPGKVDMQRVELFTGFLFADFIPKLLSLSFYVTDTSSSRHKLVFARLDDWAAHTAPFKQRFRESNLEAVGRYTKGHGAGRLRLLPKEAGSFRPIVNMKRSNQLAATRTALAVLEYHKRVMVESRTILGSITGGLSEIMDRLQGFIAAFPPGTRFAMAKVDVERCFDRVPADSLRQLVERTVDQPAYCVYKYDTVTVVSGGDVVKRYHRVAAPLGSMPRAPCANSHAIVVDRCAVSRPVSRAAVLRAVDEAVFNAHLHFDGVVYRLRSGIPQGSILSTLLCSLFYADLDRTHLSEQFGNKELLMMRYIDDMIVISPSHAEVSRVVDRLSQGFPDFGFFVNKEKTRVWLPDPDCPDLNCPDPRYPDPRYPDSAPSDWFPWCGLLLNSRLETRADLSRLMHCKLSDHLTVEYHCNPGRALLRFVRLSLKPRLHRAFFSKHNSVHVNVGSVQECAALFAVRLLSYVREHDRVAAMPFGPGIILRAITKAFRIVSRAMFGRLGFAHHLTSRLFYTVLCSVFTRFRFKHPQVLHELRQKAAPTLSATPPAQQGLLRATLDGDMRL